VTVTCSYVPLGSDVALLEVEISSVSVRSLAAGSVLFERALVKMVLYNLQPWKKRYVVLRDTWYCSPCVVTSLDIYASEPPSLAAGVDCRGDSGVRSFIPTVGRQEPYSIDLRQLTAVGFHLESRRFQFAFYIERYDDRPLLFAAESDLEMRCWVAALRMLADKVND